MIYGAFFDESDQKPGFSVAGYCAANDTWLHLDWKWQELLKEWEVEYFKASECEHLLGQFAKYRDCLNDLKSELNRNEREQQKKIKTQFIDAICEHHDDLQGYGAVVVLKDFERVVSEDSAACRLFMGKPYYICLQLCLVAAAIPARGANTYRSKVDQIQIKPIFDSHKEYSRMAEILFEKFSIKNPRSAEVLLPHSYEDDKLWRQLQVADTLAYETRKFLTSTIRKQNYLREPMRRLLPAVYRVYRLDYESLKMIVAKQTPDSIAAESVNV